MKNALSNSVNILIILGIIGIGYYNRDQLPIVIKSFKVVTGIWKPCAQPITYSIGQFDTKFGISKAEFLRTIDEASMVWENSISKDLFEYSDKGDVKINLVYDYRQNVTDQLHSLDDNIDSGKASYEAAKAKYNSLLTTYKQMKSDYESASEIYNQHKADYESKVAYWNQKGGAPKRDYNELETQRQNLNAEAEALNQKLNLLKNITDQLNTAVSELNRLAKEFNIQVGTYNTVGSSAGREFDEGEYVSDRNGERINIYQFENQIKLQRVLAHELGHALGMDHVDNSRSIMYRSNVGTNQNPSKEDLAELKAVCKI